MNEKRFSFRNQWARQQQRVLLWGFVAGVIVLIVVGYCLMGPSKTLQKPAKTPDLTGVLSSDFTNSDVESAQEKEQTQLDVLKKQITSLQKAEQHQVTQAKASARESGQVIQDLKHQVATLTEPNSLSTEGKRTSLHGNDPQSVNTLSAPPGVPLRMSTVQFTYHDAQAVTDSAKTPGNYVPSGTFVKAVMLGGADADASVNGQSNTTPVLMRILDNGTLPNGQHSHLKGCFVLASLYGDISSERGEIRLQRLSCVRQKHHILDITVQGTVFGLGGKNGVRGMPVMRNGKILWYAGLSGMFAGVGSAMQQSLTTQSISPLGATSTVPGSKVFQYGAYSGANTALSKLANYYIKRADQYHSVIQISAGTRVDIVFQQGFFLNPKQNTVVKKTASRVSHTGEALLSKLKNARLGQTIQ